MKPTNIVTLITLMTVFVFAAASSAWSYVDPGSLGATYQFGYIVFYAVLSFFAFLFSPIRHLFAKLTGRNKKTAVKSEETQAEK